MDVPVNEELVVSELSTWTALCKDCHNRKLAERRRKKGDARQEEFEYSEMSATRAIERGQTRSDRCPECRRRHRKEISAFPVAYVDITAIGEAATYVADPEVGPTGPLGGLGPLPSIHSRRTESVDLRSFALGLSDRDMLHVIETMSSHQVVVLEAGTGTGKSTLAPFRLMNPPEGSAYRPADIGPIVVTEPRVPATKEIAKFVGEAMCFGHDPRECVRHVGPGYPVGYQCEGIKVWDDACSLIYVTDGTMINWILNGDLARFSTVIVDEAHERSENIDLILTLLAAHLPRYPHLRVLIASATIDAAYFTQFFAATPTVTVGHVSIAAAKSIGYGVPLFADVDFTEEVLANGFSAPDLADPDAAPRFSLPGWSTQPLAETGGRSPRDVTRDTMLGLRAPASHWPESIDVAGAQQTMRILEGTDEGDVLVFMPSQTTVLRTRDMVLAALDEHPWGESVDVYWMMAAAPDDQKRGALGETPAGRRKVVVASNLAETSLTIAGIRYVVDSGLVVQGQWDPALALKYTRTHPHSQAGVRQRWGRVGRKTHGWVFPLYSLAQYQTLPRDSPAGSTQANLEGSMLKVLAAGEDPERLQFPADFEADGIVRDAFARESAQVFREERHRAMTALRASGAVDADGKALTRLGSELVRSRLPAEQAIALMFADRLACVPEVAMALVVLQADRLVGRSGILAADERWPSAWNVHARQCHETLAYGCADDLDLLIRIFADWTAAPDPERWCRQWWINESALVAAKATAAKVIESLAPGMAREANRPLESGLALRARAALSRALSGMRFVSGEDGLWHARSTPQAHTVSVSPLHLVPPPSDLVALGRRRAPDRGWVLGAGSVFGLVAWQDWAFEGEPDDFELLRRVSRRSNGDGGADDPARLLRAGFTIGSTLRVSPDATSSAPLIEKTTDGLKMPAVSLKESNDSALTTGSSLVYSTETTHRDADQVILEDIVNTDPLVEVHPEGEIKEVTGTDDDDDAAEEVTSAAAEIPEEEFRLAPIPILELENADLEEFIDAEDARHDGATFAFAAFVNAPSLTVRGPQPDWDTPWEARVVGYHFTEDAPSLVVEVIFGDEDDWPEIGEQVSVVAGELATTHFARGRVFRQVDAEGAFARAPKHLVFESLIDQRVGSDPDAVPEGSIWSARMLPGRSAVDSARISLTEDAARRLAAAPGSGTMPFCTLGTARFRDWQGREFVAAEVQDPSAGGFSPTVSIPISRLEKFGITPMPGIRLRIDLRNDITARQSDVWPAELIDAAVEFAPDRFEKGRKRGQLRLAGPSPLTNHERDALVALDPSSPAVLRNAWLLWDTGRRLMVRSASIVAEANVPVDDVQRIRTDLATDLRKTHDVSLTVSAAGKLVITGPPVNVQAALENLKNSLSQAPTILQLPVNATGRYPAFPEVRAVLSAMGEPAKYDARTGQVSVPAHADTGDAFVAAFNARFAWTDRQLVFAEFPGFLGFQKKPNWDAISAGIPGIQRSIAQGGRSWRLQVLDYAQFDLVVERTRALIPRAVFTVATEELTTQRVAGAARTDTMKVSYLTPTSAVEDAVEERATWVKTTASGNSFLVTLAPDGTTLTERSAFDPEQWRGESSGARWTIGAHAVEFGADPVGVSLAVEHGLDGAVDVATVRLNDLEDERARALKAVEGVGVMLITEGDDGELYECRLLDVARGGEEWWTISVDAGDDHVVVSAGGYVAVTTRAPGGYWSGDEMLPEGGAGRRTWLWLNGAMSERVLN
ncbi:helicase-like protein [Rathayibacter sp. PhB151]|uniref:DEAD/DEAH box helicase n=1 Tax=Rathayibacter sp. PhB151 TaxID=2485189 RepID=UPI0010626CBE|nr:DEAD/DEAH box helicase [Rathayibacter sp. PhB151]TDX79077.1 helicase-like protein [Rathayibacter sp. PhB151]